LQDEDNFNGCLKPLLDAMVEMAVIQDDSPEHITLIAKQVVDRNLAYLVEIELEAENAD
jgi:uncharacterized protein (UPF0212 family)